MTSAEFAQINERFDRLEEQIAALQRRPRRRDSDDAILARLLPACAGKWGSAPFRTKEVFEDRVLSQLLGDKNRREIGNLFRRFVGVPVGDYIVNRSVTEHGAALWIVSRSLKLPELPDPISRSAQKCDIRTG